MSTRSTIYDDKYLTVYKEGTEFRESIIGEFLGYDLHVIVDKKHLESISITDGCFYVDIVGHDYLMIHGRYVCKFDYDIDGLEIVLKGGSVGSKILIEELKLRENKK